MWSEPASQTPKTANSGTLGVSWPAVASCALLVGLIAAATGADLIRESLHHIFAPAAAAPQEEPRKALVITANRRDELTAIATLGPRGYRPLLAGNESETLAQIRANPHAVQFAVVDESLPDFAPIARALREALPNAGIVVLGSTHRCEDLGALLLERL
jgi:hypothetical protein